MLQQGFVKLRWIVPSIVLIVVAFVGVLAWRLPISSERLRASVIETLSEQLDSDVELGSLTVRTFPRLRAEGARLTIRRKGQAGYPPLISVKSFTVDGTVMGLYRKHVARVDLVGLDIQIPPNDHDEHEKTRSGRSLKGDIVVDHLLSTDARLVIIPRTQGKSPKVWNIHRLHMNNVGLAQAMPFQATLTNAIPPGEIETTGHFGPWERDDPGATPLDGTFSFEKADLSVFKGISGILSAHGSFGGQLERIDIHGETSTPQFTVAVGGHPVPLNATYHTHRRRHERRHDPRAHRRDVPEYVDSRQRRRDRPSGPAGTRGLAERDHRSRPAGRRADARREDTTAADARRVEIEHTLRAAAGRSGCRRQAAIERAIQHCGRTIHQRRGSAEDQRAEPPRPCEETAVQPQQVGSDFNGQFALADGVLSLPRVTFDVPGASVQLAGQYALRQETLNFRGNLMMDAKVSQAVGGGVKGMLLKVIDPIFQKNGRTVIPIKISGTRQTPSFGFDAARFVQEVMVGDGFRSSASSMVRSGHDGSVTRCHRPTTKSTSGSAGRRSPGEGGQTIPSAGTRRAWSRSHCRAAS